MDALLAEVRACRLCAEHLPLGQRPTLRAHPAARLLIVGQAPGTRVHATDIPWNNPSGDRLREWLGLDREAFYDKRRIALMPMGLCYPGRDAGGGDRPPRRECAPRWHAPVQAALPNIELTLLVGQYAQAYYLPGLGDTMTERVLNFAAAPPGYLPLPHPSWRVNGWLKRNPWFAAEVLPVLRRKVRAMVRGARMVGPER